MAKGFVAISHLFKYFDLNARNFYKLYKRSGNQETLSVGLLVGGILTRNQMTTMSHFLATAFNNALSGKVKNHFGMS